MKRIAFIFVMILAQYGATGQVTKHVIVEHFTNTHCSVCATRNPGFYTNRAQFPQVIHIAYHPSAPYAACPLNQHNKTENDDRTHYYSIYGATPRLVIQGKVIPSNTNYGDAALFQSELGQMSAFDMETKLSPSGSGMATVNVKLKKVSASSLSSLQLYAAMVEDTLFFTAANGETHHYDVFRKSVWGAPMTITAPSNIGDSIIYTQTVALSSAWVIGRMYAIATLQDANKEIVQVAKSATLDIPTAIATTQEPIKANIYPNPTQGLITVKINKPSVIQVHNVSGTLLTTIKQQPGSESYDFNSLPAGVYTIQIIQGQSSTRQVIIKE